MRGRPFALGLAATGSGRHISPASAAGDSLERSDDEEEPEEEEEEEEEECLHGPSFMLHRNTRKRERTREKT